MLETLNRTNLADINPGDLLNFERSLRLGDLISGHLVMEHVDFVGILEKIEALEDGSTKMCITIPQDYMS